MSSFKCELTPFRWPLLNILTVCCTSVSVVHWLPKAEQPVIGGLIKPPRAELAALFLPSPLMHHLVLIAPLSLGDSQIRQRLIFHDSMSVV